MVKLSGSVSLIVAGALLLAGVGASAEEQLPNIIFILADDLGYADTGATGARSIETPNIDRLADGGVTLVNAYASSAICSPTRTALLTGRYPHRFRIGLEEPLRSSDAEKYDLGVPKDQVTIASALRDLGYETALIGKWHLGIPPKHSPLEHGYDDFFGIVQGAADYFRHTMIRHGESSSRGLYKGNEATRRDGYLTDILGNEAVRKIRSITDKPLFLSLHFTAPHWPWQGRNDAHLSDQLIQTQHYDGGTLNTYAEMVGVMDENIGKVLDALEETGLANNSIVIFTNDNGGERFSDNWPFTGIKGELLEGGIRVPLLIRWPGQIAPDSQSEQVMTSMDFLPTLVAAAGGQVPAESIDGMNLLPQLTGRGAETERTLFWRYKASDQAAVRQGEWKYLKIAGREYLFNVATDPRERAVLQDKYPDRVNDMRSLYEQWNRSMLPYPQESFSEAVENVYVDRY